MKTGRVGEIVGAAVIGIACVSGLSGCGGGGGDNRPIEIRFGAKVSGDSFACGASYDGVGASGTRVLLRDLRFYVHDVQLLGASGARYPVSLENDGVWQNNGLALLDFENGEGLCSSEGDPATNTVLRGAVGEGDFTGISFVVGVPFEMNHVDAQTAPPPQNTTAMWWNWNAGFKFLKLDLATPRFPTGWSVHVGSTACSGNGAGGVKPCANPNRVSVALSPFDPDTQSIVLDVGELLATSNLDANTPQTAPGCMSAPTDPECAPLFSKLGLRGEAPSVFYVE